MRIAPQGADIRFDEKQIEEGRNFCNKLWNICRFRTLQGQVDFNAEPWKHPRSIFADELLERLHVLLEGERNVNAALAQFNFSEAAALLYDFVWNEFAARFVEAAKSDFPQAESPTHAGHAGHFRLRDEPRAAAAASVRALRDGGTVVRARLRHGNDPDHAVADEVAALQNVVARARRKSI